MTYSIKNLDYVTHSDWSVCKFQAHDIDTGNHVTRTVCLRSILSLFLYTLGNTTSSVHLFTRNNKIINIGKDVLVKVHIRKKPDRLKHKYNCTDLLINPSLLSLDLDVRIVGCVRWVPGKRTRPSQCTV